MDTIREFETDTESLESRAFQEVDRVSSAFWAEAKQDYRPEVHGFTIDDRDAQAFDDGVSIDVFDDKGYLSISVVDATLLPEHGYYESYLRSLDADDWIKSWQRKKISLHPQNPTPSISFVFEFDIDKGGGVANPEVSSINLIDAMRTSFVAVENFSFDSSKEDLEEGMGQTEKFSRYRLLTAVGKHLKEGREARALEYGIPFEESRMSDADMFTTEINIELGVTVAHALTARGVDAAYYQRDLLRSTKISRAFGRAHENLANNGYGNFTPITSPLREPSDLLNLRTFVSTVIDGEDSPYTLAEILTTRSRQKIEDMRVDPNEV